MQSLTCVKAGHGVEMREIELGDLGPRDALVRTTLSTICGTDLHALERPGGDGLPLGHEAVGVIEAAGAGVQRLAVGDRVVASCLLVCGHCRPCLDGQGEICETFRKGPPGPLLTGAQGQYYVIRAVDTTAARVPDGVHDDQAIFAADIFSIALATLERANIRAGDSVAVFGQGPVGLCVTAAAKLLGAGLIIAVEGVAERREVARRMGANLAVHPDEAVARIRAQTEGRGVDIAVDAVGGNVAVFQNACRASRDGGVVSTVLGIQAPPPDVPLLHRTLVATLCPSGTRRLERLFGLFATGKVDLSPLITHRMSLAETPRGYDLFRNRAAGAIKVVLEP